MSWSTRGPSESWVPLAYYESFGWSNPSPSWGNSQSYSVDLAVGYNLYVGRSWSSSEVLFD